MRTMLALVLLAGIVLGSTVTWKEDTLFRTGTWITTETGELVIAPGETTDVLMLAYYPWTQLWAYAVLDSVYGLQDTGARVDVEWCYGSYDPYTRTQYWSLWAEALPTPWFLVGAPSHMTVYDSLYLGPLYDWDVPLAWVDRVRFRVITKALSDSCAINFWVRRRTFSEAGDRIPDWWFGPQ